QVAEAQFLLQNLGAYCYHRKFDRRIQKQLNRIVTRLAVNIYATGIVRSLGIIQPEIVRKPRICVSNDHEIASAIMVDVVFFFAHFIQYFLHSRRLLQERLDFRQLGLIIDIHVRHLVISDGEYRRGTRIEGLQTALVFYLDPALLTEDTIEMYWFADRRDAIFRKKQNVRALFFKVSDQIL